ncbi:MAG: N-acetylmuramoyl-L-alanine amidase [Planctomycetes bacterium]|nr:N-acetylmuramoyl-L-alanine amidase [Planctomycetota bacterium]
MIQRTWFVLVGSSILVAAMPSLAGEAVRVRFYRDGDLVLVDRTTIVASTPIETAVRALVAGPTPEELTAGLTSAIPAGTGVVGLVAGGDSVAVDLSPEVLAGLDESKLLAIFDQFRATLFDWPEIRSIRLTSKGELLSTYLPPPVLSSESLPPPQEGVTTAVGLAGKNITLGPSHGRYWNGSYWNWQRSDPCGFGQAVLEDTNSIRLAQFLYQYLAQDGATVYVARQLDEGDCCNSATGLAWWKMCAQTWLHAQGLPCSVWGTSTGNCGADDAVNRYNDDIRARPLFADYRGSHIYISHHTNAGAEGTANGTITYRDTAMEHPAHETASYNLALAVQNSIVSAIREMYDSGWYDRGVGNSNGGFGEIRIPNRPACLIELAFHDNCTRDALYLTDNFFRSLSEWAVYRGVCQYFGATPGWDRYSDELVGDTIPSTMIQGQDYPVTVTFRNRGVVWSNGRSFRLGAVNDSDPFTSFNRVNLSGEVRPGSDHTFNFTMTAPSTPGQYTSDWRMVRDGVAWFGATLVRQITVGVQGIPGDMDGDRDVDLEDFGRVQACLLGIGVPQNDPACARANLDGDTDVDETDIALFIGCLTAPGVEGSADCAN